jgi:tetratricopeptide (TPR) repeat protein
MRWQVVSILALWVGGEIAFLAFLWQPWLLWPGSVLMVAGFAGMIVTVRGESRGRPGADLMSGIVDHTREVYEGRVQILGADHPEVLRSRDILAGIYARAGRLAEAIDHFEQNLADAERVLGPDHRGTLLYRNSLAGAYGKAGRSTESIGLCEQNLAEAERVLGPVEINTLDYRNSLAGAYERAGRPTEAIRLYEQNLADCERGTGTDYLGALLFRNSLAGAYERWDGRPKPSVCTSGIRPTPSGSGHPTTHRL